MPVYSSLLTALGWSLLNSIWQMAVCWIAYSLLTIGNKHFSSAAKHNLALISILAGSAWFVYSFFNLMNEPADYFIPGFIPVSKAADQWIPYGAMVYLVIIILRGLQYTIQHYRYWKAVAGRSVSYRLQSFTNRNARLLGISKKISVCFSEQTETAQTSGFLKPLILLPVSLMTSLSPVQLEAILVHELFHIRRNDYLINIFMACYRGVFFNPFAHLFYKVIAAERELACDDGVIQMNYQPAIYAEALYSLEKFRQVNPGFAIAADGNKPWLLMDRIRRVLGKPAARKNHVRPVVLFNIVIAIALFGMQTETFRQPFAVPIPAVASLTATPAHYAMEKEGIEKPGKEAIKVFRNHKHTIKKTAAPMMLVIVNDTVSATEPDALEQVYFANDNTVKNFSNESSAGMSKAPVQIINGTPYVSDESVTYQRIADILPDSIPEKLAENNIREMIAQSHLEIANTLKQVETEIKVQKHYLKEMEIKNRRLILLNQKTMGPMLEKIRHEIDTKRKQIDQLQIQLQVSDEEIIHI